MLGKAGKLGILTGASEDLGVTSSDRTAALTFKRMGHYCGSARLGPSAHEFVDELDKLIREANGDLLAHPNMVPVW
jgi:hypothetical protein